MAAITICSDLEVQENKVCHCFHCFPGKKVGAVTDFTFLGSKITADGKCSHEIQRHLLLGRKAMANLESILKSRDISLLTKGPYSQSYSFSSSHAWM